MKHKYLVITHNFFCNKSDGFKVYDLGEMTEEKAQSKCYELGYKNQKDFSYCAVKLIQLDKEDKVYKPRKLSWYERLTGYLREE